MATRKNKKPSPKSQRKISNDLVTPYENSESMVGNLTNPNDNDIPNSSRSNQISFKGDNTKEYKVGISDIDESIFYYFNNIIKPTVIQNNVVIPIPIIYGSPERWVSAQKQGYLKDKDGAIMSPLIMFKRDSIEKNRSIGNKIDANNPHNYGIFQKSYDNRNAYDNFSILNGKKPQKTKYTVVIPDYVTINYSCTIFTYYIEQMNGVIEAINYASDSYWGDPERFKFNARIDSFNTVTELVQNQERSVKSNFNIKLNGYLIPDIINKSLNSINKFSDKTEIIITETTINNQNI